MSAPNTCSNDIYSNLNYEKLRQENLNKTQDLYQSVLNQYSNSYTQYLKTQSDAIGNPNDATAQNKKDQANTQDRPKLKVLNQKLIDIESELLNNNKLVRSDIDEQRKDMELNNKERDYIANKIREIENTLKDMQEKSDSSNLSVEEIKMRFDSSTIWYYIIIFLNLVFFGLFIFLFYKLLNNIGTQMQTNGNTGNTGNTGYVNTGNTGYVNAGNIRNNGNIRNGNK